jgi:hypothetical protein
VRLKTKQTKKQTVITLISSFIALSIPLVKKGIFCLSKPLSLSHFLMNQYSLISAKQIHTNTIYFDFKENMGGGSVGCFFEIIITILKQICLDFIYLL